MHMHMNRRDDRAALRENGFQRLHELIGRQLHARDLVNDDEATGLRRPTQGRSANSLERHDVNAKPANARTSLEVLMSDHSFSAGKVTHCESDSPAGNAQLAREEPIHSSALLL